MFVYLGPNGARLVASVLPRGWSDLWTRPLMCSCSKAFAWIGAVGGCFGRTDRAASPQWVLDHVRWTYWPYLSLTTARSCPKLQSLMRYGPTLWSGRGTSRFRYRRSVGFWTTDGLTGAASRPRQGEATVSLLRSPRSRTNCCHHRVYPRRRHPTPSPRTTAHLRQGANGHGAMQLRP